MNTLKLKIVRIDHDGYNGRDFHPNDSHLGLVCTVVGSATRYLNGEGDRSVDEEVIGADGRLFSAGTYQV